MLATTSIQFTTTKKKKVDFVNINQKEIMDESHDSSQNHKYN